MAENRGVAYVKQGVVEVQSIDFPKMVDATNGKQIDHGVILKVIMAIHHGKTQIAKAVNVTVITLDQAPQGYKDFDKGAAKKFVIDSHGMVAA